MNEANSFTVDKKKDMSEENRKLLENAGVKRLVGGHRPSGATATFYQQGDIECLNVRTSFDNVMSRNFESRVSGRGGWARLEVNNGVSTVFNIKPSKKDTAQQVFLMLQANTVYKL